MKSLAKPPIFEPLMDQGLRPVPTVTWQRWLEELQAIVAYVRIGNGAPENVVAAPVGTVYLRVDGGAGTTIYVKEAGTDATGWAAK